MDLIKTEAERKMIDDLFVLSPALVAELDRYIGSVIVDKSDTVRPTSLKSANAGAE